MIKVDLRNDKIFSTLKTLVSLGVALIITFVVLCLTSDAPIQSFGVLLTAPLKNLRYFGNVLEMMVPLIFTSLACAILFRAGIVNLGVEGIFYITGILTTGIATKLVISNNVLHSSMAILASGILGGILMLIPGFFKVKYNTNIIVTSLMLNSVYFGIGMWILKEFMSADDVSIVASPLFQETAKLPCIIPGTRLTISFVIALLSVIVMHFIMKYSRLGYKIRITGMNQNFAKYSGISAFSLVLFIHFVSGFFAGVGSSTELLSLYNRFTWAKVTTHGVTGVLIAMMGNNKPIPVFIAAFGISYLKTGAEIMSRSTKVPVEIISIVEATLVILISSQYFLRGIREKKLLKEGMKDE